MRRFGIFAAAVLVFWSASVASGERVAPKPVEPVVHNGIKYVATHEKIGYVEAWDVKTGKKLWEKPAYDWEKLYHKDHRLEADVQWVFITALRVEGDKLLVTDERGNTHTLDIAADAQPEPGKEIQQFIADLGADDAKVREAAQKGLLVIGKLRACDAVKKATADHNAIRAREAKIILDEFDNGTLAKKELAKHAGLAAENGLQVVASHRLVRSDLLESYWPGYAFCEVVGCMSEPPETVALGFSWKDGKAFVILGLDDLKPHLRPARNEKEAAETACVVAGFSRIGMGCIQHRAIKTYPKAEFKCEKNADGCFVVKYKALTFEFDKLGNLIRVHGRLCTRQWPHGGGQPGGDGWGDY